MLPIAAASTQSRTLSAAPRFLICRLSAIGDCILTMPLASALRAQFPAAFIAWAVQGASAPLVAGHAAVDQVIRVSKQDLRSLTGLCRLRRQLRALRFDVALDPQGLSKSAGVAWLSGATRRIGFRAPVGREVSTWLNNELVTSRKTHVVDRYLDLLAPLGITAPAVQFGVPCDAAAQSSVAPLLEQTALRRGFAVINPGAGWESKLWPAERFAAVATHLGVSHGLASLVVWAGERERSLAVQITQAANDHAVLAPSTSLLELAVLLKRAKLFVGSDTGPLHMAAAVGTRCVGIYGPTRPEECGPYGMGHVTVQAYYQEGSCRQRRSASNLAMQEVSIAAVCQACDQALGVSPSHSIANSSAEIARAA